MPAIAAELESRYGFRVTVLKSYPDENSETDIPGLEALAKADLAVFFLRWRRLPQEQIAHIRKYLDSGKPVDRLSNNYARLQLSERARTR